MRAGNSLEFWRLTSRRGRLEEGWPATRLGRSLSALPRAAQRGTCGSRSPDGRSASSISSGRRRAHVSLDGALRRDQGRMFRVEGSGPCPARASFVPEALEGAAPWDRGSGWTTGLSRRRSRTGGDRVRGAPRANTGSRSGASPSGRGGTAWTTPGRWASRCAASASKPAELRRWPIHWKPLAAEVTGCTRCPRLVEWRERARRSRRAATAGERYWARPLPGFGDPRARIVIVGLAPAAHGGNRTGRIFTGDRSGRLAVRRAPSGRTRQPADSVAPRRRAAAAGRLHHRGQPVPAAAEPADHRGAGQLPARIWSASCGCCARRG